MSIFPAAAFGLCALCLFFYTIGRKMEAAIADALAARRRAFHHTRIAGAP